MPEKTDEEIIKEVGLETIDSTTEKDALEALSLGEDEKSKNNNDFEELIPVTKNSDANNDTLENESSDNITNSQDVIENEDKDDETKKAYEELENEIPIQKKQPKIYKILMIVVATLATVLTIGTILFFTGFFEPEEPKTTTDKKIEKTIKPEIEFNEEDINKDELNKKLSSLTKTEIMNKEELEAEERRIKEEERKKKEAEEKLLEEKRKQEEEKYKAELAKIEEEKKLLEEHRMAIKKEQEEFLKLQEEAAKELEAKKNELINQINQTPIEKTNIEEKTEVIQKVEVKTFIPFINVATIKGDLYKSYLNKVLKFDKNMSLCRDSKNRIEIYFGPYDSQKERTKVLNNLIENGFKESYSVDFTQEEYEKRCKY